MKKEEFIKIVNAIKPNENGCKLWYLDKFNHGYGRVWMEDEKKRWLTHRLAFFLLKDPDARRNCVIKHSCDVPLCCNIDHLSSGTHSENIQESFDKGRSKANNLKLTDEQITEIRRLSSVDKLTNVAIGKIYGIHPTWISRIKNNVYR